MREGLDGLEARAEDVDMFTTVVIGNSTTYLHQRSRPGVGHRNRPQAEPGVK